MTLHVAAIVEGHGEQLCVPNLLHRVWSEHLGAVELLRVAPPARKKRDQITKEAHLHHLVNEAVAKLRQQARGDPDARLLVLILIDSEGACPVPLAAQLLGWARAARSDADVACVLAHPVYETWFVAAASSLAGINGMPSGLTTPADPEDGKRGKRWIEAQLRRAQKNRTYTETIDQPLFSQKMDLGLCHRHSRSFRKLCQELAARLPPPVGDEDEPSAPLPEGPA